MIPLLSSLLVAVTLSAVTPSPDASLLRTLLDEFLAGASRNELSVHERFWAEDLIYTGSSGRRVGKADILRDVAASPAPSATDPQVRFAAEEVRIQVYGTSALVAFRLVATTVSPESTQVASYLNSGMFLKRKGRWQVVGWQATKKP